MFLRLRQLCLVAQDLEPVVDDLAAVLGIEVGYRDPVVGRYGLHNAVLPIGNSFLEVVSPLRENTTAARYLQRRQGNGGYMVILDTDALPRWRDRMASLGVRIAAATAHGDYQGLQLHPRDTGGALLEINSTIGGASLDGPYGPAGPHWRHAVRTQRVQAVASAELQSDDPGRLAARWAEVLQRPVAASGDTWRIRLDNALLRFVHAADERGEGLCGIDIRTVRPHEVLEQAQRRGLATTAGSVTLGGVRFYLDDN